MPDGRIDPRGRTLRILNHLVEVKPCSTSVIPYLRFPLALRPAESYKEGMRAFGSSRSGGRKHAGCDLYAAPGTKIYSLSDGEVIDIYDFYLGTKAVEINHGAFVARYGEVRSTTPGLKKGSMVARGDNIAEVGELVFASGTKMSMLHLELYRGNIPGRLTLRGHPPYHRRDDLLDPTPYLDRAVMQ